jgi:hypothetical protein
MYTAEQIIHSLGMDVVMAPAMAMAMVAIPAMVTMFGMHLQD